MRGKLSIVCLVVILLGCNSKPTNRGGVAENSTTQQIDNLLKKDSTGTVSAQDIEKCKQAIELSKAINDKHAELKAMVQLLDYHDKTENFREVIEIGNEALKLATQQNNAEFLARIYQSLGTTNYHISNFHKSFEYYQLSLNCYIQLNDTLNQINVLNMQGNIYFAWDDYSSALEYYEEILELSTHIDNNQMIAKSLTNIGIAYAAMTEKLKNNDTIDHYNKKSLFYINNAVLFIDKTKSKVMKAEILNNLAIITFRNAKQHQKAIEIISEARKLARGLSDRVYVSSSLTYANILNDIDSVEKALLVLEDAMQIAESKELNVAIMNMLHMISEIHAKKRNHFDAYTYHKQYSELSDSIFDKNNKNSKCFEI